MLDGRIKVPLCTTSATLSYGYITDVVLWRHKGCCIYDSMPQTSSAPLTSHHELVKFDLGVVLCHCVRPPLHCRCTETRYKPLLILPPNLGVILGCKGESNVEYLEGLRGWCGYTLTTLMWVERLWCRWLRTMIVVCEQSTHSGQWLHFHSRKRVTLCAMIFSTSY